ncbi:MAG: tRNA (adenosine(37)-N6)-threonylcarbamoyltransferase complex ATPase subunit type 1 TsaE [Acidaminococcaceae bacterium]|nr:tRNA (adenosine(37)-N6)-threonylcarbamoyltransferase complex ATPase subunit type 1 TsaE [Acidaminococcaceae bacterium]HBX75427.1 tRNA (adenosine(37)-N6)-threonylcarbamoyltransferase complex ATPase subunit type 1 TsaE [Acidaminococcaceae bacterium]
MDTHSHKKKHQTDNSSDGAGPVPEPLPGLTGITWRKESDGPGTSFFLADEKATEKFGRLLGMLAADGDVYCLSGDLGAGKTLMSKGVCQAVGVEDEDVVSPTFALMNIYNGKLMEVRHFDLYRLDSPEELADIGFYEYVGGEGVSLIEWGDLFQSELPPEYMQVNLSIVPGGRVVELIPFGLRYEAISKEVLRHVNAGA